MEGKKRNREKKAKKEKVTDEILTTVSLLSHERGHTGQSRVTESTCTAGHHTVPGKEIKKSRACSRLKHFNSQQNLCRLRPLTNITRLRSPHAHTHSHVIHVRDATLLALASESRQIIRIP